MRSEDELSTDSRAAHSGRRRFLIQAGGSAVFIGIVYWLVDLDTLWRTLRRMPIWLWAFTVLVHSALHVVQAAKWRAFLAMSGVKVRVGVVLQAHAAGQFGGVILPSVLGGDAVRTALVVRNVGKPEAVLFAGVVDRIVDTACMLTLIGIGFVLAPSALDGSALEVHTFLLIALATGTVAGLVGLRWLLRPASLRKLPRRVAIGVLRARRAFRTMQRHPRQALVAFAIGLAIQACFVVTVILIGETLGLNLDTRLWFLFWPVAKMAAMLPASLGGLGVLELTFSFLVRGFADRDVAIAIAVVMQTVRLAVAVLGGGYWLATSIGSRSVRRVADPG